MVRTAGHNVLRAQRFEDDRCEWMRHVANHDAIRTSGQDIPSLDVGMAPGEMILSMFLASARNVSRMATRLIRRGPRSRTLRFEDDPCEWMRHVANHDAIRTSGQEMPSQDVRMAPDALILSMILVRARNIVESGREWRLGSQGLVRTAGLYVLRMILASGCATLQTTVR
ncbi:hypothetical protein C5Y93_14515 [Blastopirellula marina]|uniref:Uncharacterized protein n=1 Tax=Blastopirellula marina TaxID=124 RepID=A0A2S8GMJ2_9BACT|nr:hypothetical protein C5Y93_14515 [Blastopirellula marina]